MFEEELEESWLYQRIFEKGYKKGLEEASERKVCELLRETFIVFLNAQYPILVDLARGQISGINETKRLQEIINKVFYLQTASEIEEYLLSLHDDAAKN